MPAIPPLAQHLSDGHVELRMASEWDIPDILIAHQDDPRLYLALGLERPPSGAELGRAAERAADELASGTRAELTILQPGGVDCRGRIDIHGIRWDQAQAEVGIWVAPALRGRGVARRALRLAAGWLFGPVGLERLAMLTEPDNIAMLRAAEAAGFVREGVLRAAGREYGRRIDLVSLSLLARDLAAADPRRPPGAAATGDDGDG